MWYFRSLDEWILFYRYYWYHYVTNALLFINFIYSYVDWRLAHLILTIKKVKCEIKNDAEIKWMGMGIQNILNYLVFYATANNKNNNNKNNNNNEVKTIAEQIRKFFNLIPNFGYFSWLWFQSQWQETGWMPHPQRTRQNMLIVIVCNTVTRSPSPWFSCFYFESQVRKPDLFLVFNKSGSVFLQGQQAIFSQRCL